MQTAIISIINTLKAIEGVICLGLIFLAYWLVGYFFIIYNLVNIEDGSFMCHVFHFTLLKKAFFLLLGEHIRMMYILSKLVLSLYYTLIWEGHWLLYICQPLVLISQATSYMPGYFAMCFSLQNIEHLTESGKPFSSQTVFLIKGIILVKICFSMLGQISLG